MDYTKDLIRKILNEQFANVRAGAGEDNITKDVKDILKSMGATTVEGRFQALSDPKSNTTKTQEGFAAIMLLQYLRDIKNNFNATSAGFLFEDFIAGILDGSKPSGNPAVDVYDNSGEGYQIKLYNDNTSSIKLSSQYDISQKEQNVKYFIVGIKTGDNINTYIMDINTYNNVKDSSYKIDKIYAKNNKGGKSSRSEKVDLRKLKGNIPIDGERGKDEWGEFKYNVKTKDNGVKISDFPQKGTLLGALELDVEGKISEIGVDIYKNVVSLGEDLKKLEDSVQKLILNVDDTVKVNQTIKESKEITNCLTGKMNNFQKGVADIPESCKNSNQ
tara:strand:+ start:84 stop:1076 length:993 start_codon:yes stop_codon:yes gene_type:complete